MSYLLNVFNGRSKSEEFIEVLVDNKVQNWFKRAHIGWYLGIAHIITSTTKLLEEDIRSQAFLQAEGGIRSTDPPRNDAQDHDIFISLTGALFMVVNSKRARARCLKNTSWKISYRMDLIQELKRSRKSIDRPLKKRMQQLHYSTMT